MSSDPLDLIDVASRQFVDEIARLPRRVDRLSDEVRNIKRVLAVVATILVGVTIEAAKNIVTKFMGQ